MWEFDLVVEDLLLDESPQLLAISMSSARDTGQARPR
jgi:hypothetical protein